MMVMDLTLVHIHRTYFVVWSMIPRHGISHIFITWSTSTEIWRSTTTVMHITWCSLDQAGWIRWDVGKLLMSYCSSLMKKAANIMVSSRRKASSLIWQCPSSLITTERRRALIRRSTQSLNVLFGEIFYTDQTSSYSGTAIHSCVHVSIWIRAALSLTFVLMLPSLSGRQVSAQTMYGMLPILSWFRRSTEPVTSHIMLVKVLSVVQRYATMAKKLTCAYAVPRLTSQKLRTRTVWARHVSWHLIL